jgi:patatin-like phospholipase/acyl hydrolase
MKGSHDNPGIPFRILSLDGGGIRGAFIAGFLADLEQRLECRITDHFDLIAGTSTGAIIAAALALREPAKRIEDFYRDRGADIFTRRKALPLGGFFKRRKAKVIEKIVKPHDLDYDHLQQSKYDGTALATALNEVFGNRTLGAARTRLVIPAVDLTRGQTIVFKTPHIPNMFRDRHRKVTDVLRATSAAPTYFPHAVIDQGSGYVDGGLWANNPSMVAVAEALKIRESANRPNVDRPIELESIYLLSVGTGKASYFANPPRSGAGIFWWAPNLYNVASVSQSQGINFQTQFILGDRARRIDYDLPDGTWSLDKVDMLAQMITIGHERSIENLANLRPLFFDTAAQHPYLPFPDAAAAGAA